MLLILLHVLIDPTVSLNVCEYFIILIIFSVGYVYIFCLIPFFVHGVTNYIYVHHYSIKIIYIFLLMSSALILFLFVTKITNLKNLIISAWSVLLPLIVTVYIPLLWRSLLIVIILKIPLVYTFMPNSLAVPHRWLITSFCFRVSVRFY